MRKTVALGLAAVLSAGLTSCSGAGTAADPSPAIESATAGASTSASPTAPVSAPTPDIPVSGVTTTSKGQYLQTTFDASEPAWNLDPAIVDPSAAGIDPADMLEGYRHILTFLAEEGIDSPLNGGGQTPSEWWAEHEQDISAPFREDLRRAMVDENRPVLVRETGVQQYEGYSYVYDPARPRLTSRTIKPTKLWTLDNEALTIAVEAQVEYTMAVQPKPGTTQELRQPSNGTMTYSATKDTDGHWRIDGYDQKVATTPAWEP